MCSAIQRNFDQLIILDPHRGDRDDQDDRECQGECDRMPRYMPRIFTVVTIFVKYLYPLCEIHLLPTLYTVMDFYYTYLIVCRVW